MEHSTPPEGPTVSVKVHDIDLYVLNMRTRMPFRYGIASMTAVPYLFVRCDLEADGERRQGVAADILPPKWFTKNPETPFRDDLVEMRRVIESACGFTRQIGRAETVFDLWQQVYNAQKRWAAGEGYPPLLWNFGVSLAERAVIDAFCRATNMTLDRVVRANTLGIRLGALYSELAADRPADLLPEKPLRTIIARHAVGLADPPTDADIPDAERLDDGLPQSLEAAIRAYGLTHFKIKIGGSAARDLERLKRIAAVIRENAAPDYAFTLDGNETYQNVAQFRALWQSLTDDPELADFLRHLIFVEQPLHRDAALSAETQETLNRWNDRPPIIIDESDGEIGSLPRALACGYVGTSHKNCKGIFKGIANACLIAHLRRAHPDRPYILSGEDLCNVGPVALLQDMAALATLGIDHAERNGHHYFRGLSMLPDDLQESVLSAHPDLYRRHERGFPTLNVRQGRVEVDSVVDAPFGCGFEIDPSRFTPLTAWNPDTVTADG